MLQEFSAVAARKLGLTPARARKTVAEYADWCVMETTPQLIVSASLLQEEHGVASWDALIVEAALLAGATELLSRACRAVAVSRASPSATRSPGRECVAVF